MPRTVTHSRGAILCAAILGMTAAWVAAGSTGLLAHGLRHAIAWVLLLLIAGLAWPAGAGRWREKVLVIVAAVGSLLLTASTVATLNVLAVTLLLGALALVNHREANVTLIAGTFRERSSEPCGALLVTAQATAVLALFQFAQASIATFWQVADTAAGALGSLGGTLSGQPLNVGSSLAGLDYFVLSLSVVGILAIERRLRVTTSLVAVAALLLGHLSYLMLLAQSERILIATATMRTERLFAHASTEERERLLGAIKFELVSDSTVVPGLSEQDLAARRAAEQKAFDAELASLGLERKELDEINAELRNEAEFPEWLAAGMRAKLLDKLKPALDALEQERLFGPATRLPYTLDGFLLSAVPWNLPVVALLIHTILMAVILCAAFRRRPTGRQGEIEIALECATPHLPFSSAGRLPRFAAAFALVAVLLPLTTVYSRLAGSYKGKKIVAYEKGFLNWLRPEYGNMVDNMNFGRLSVGMYGMVEPFVESLGMNFTRSKNLSAEDLKDADVLVLFYPNRRWSRSQVERIYEFVERGGSLLVAGEHTIHEARKKPGDIVYPGEEEPTLEPGDDWIGDEEGNRVNDLMERFGMQIAFDSAEFAVGGWLQSYATVSHPTTAGLRDERNTFGAVVGASVDAPWPARPIILGRYGIGDLGDMSKSETGSYMGDSRYNAGERLGDIVLAAEKRIGHGRVILFGDTSGFTNNLTVSGHPFTARLYAYLASESAGNPQAPWRQTIGLLLLAAAIALVIVGRQPAGVLVLALGLGASLWTCTVLTARGNEVLPRGVEYAPPPDVTLHGDEAGKASRPEYRGPNNLAYIDAAHHSAASDESLRPDGVMGLTYMLMRHNYLALSLPELTGEWLMDEPERRDPNLGVNSLKARLVLSVAPQRPYSSHEIDLLDEYVARGGRLILTIGADDAGPARRLLERFQLNVGLYNSSTAYGVAGEPPGTAVSFEPFLNQQPREPTPLGHFKSPYTMVRAKASDGSFTDQVEYSPFVRFHAGWPISSGDPTALVVAQYGKDLPLVIVKRHGPPLPQDIAAGRARRSSSGLIVLVGDTGFAMNKNLEREDGLPIEGMRENAFFWRWLLDLLEYEVESWIPPPQQATPAAPDPAASMFDTLEIPLLKKEPETSPPGDTPASPAEVPEPVGVEPRLDESPKPSNEEIKGPLLVPFNGETSAHASDAAPMPSSKEDR
jgi:hypothetical protein